MIESNEAAEPDHRTVTIELPPRQRQITLELTGDVMTVRVPATEGVGADEPVYLGTVMVKGQDEPVRVTLYERDGSQVLVRRVDPCDIDAPPVALFDGDQVRVMEAISHTSLHTNRKVGSTDGFMFHMRVVPVRVEGTTTYARTLRHDEVDDGRGVHAIPGGQITLEEGSLVAELDHIDDQAEPTSSGHVPLTPVLWTWLSIGTDHDEARTRFLLAAARRLDTANLLLIEVQERTDRLNQEGLAGPAIRRNLFELVGCVEQAVISLGRAVDMVLKARDQIGRDLPIPQVLADATETSRTSETPTSTLTSGPLATSGEGPTPMP